MSAGTASGWFQFPREDAQGTTEPRLLFSFWIRFNSPEKMLRGQHQRLTVLPHLSVSIPPRRCSGDNGQGPEVEFATLFQFPREDAQGTTARIHSCVHRVSFNSPEKMLRGQRAPLVHHPEPRGFNSPEKMLRGQLPSSPEQGPNARFNSPEKMLRGQLSGMPQHPARMVSIPPRRCSGDNQST